MSTSEPLHIAILDDYLSIAAPYFSAIPNLTITSHPQTLHPLHSPSDHAALISRLQPYHIISTMRERTPLPRSILSSLPNLKLLLITTSRNFSIDETAAHNLNIMYAGTTSPAHHDPRVATLKGTFSNPNEHMWALLLSLAKNIPTDDLNVKSNFNGGWQTSLVTGLAGKTLGLLGLGKLGTQAAITAKLGFDMSVIAWSANLTQEKADAAAAKAGLPAGSFKAVSSLRELCETSDVFSVQMVLSERSRGMIGAEQLSWLKGTCLLVNTSRGPIIDEKALLETLKQGKIRGAALDVFWKEPVEESSEWRSMKWGTEGRSKLILTPHTGFSEEATMHEWYRQQAENVKRWMKGEEVLCRILPEGVKAAPAG